MFKIDLVVQIHVPDTTAPRVISMVGTIANLINEVLQAAVGNHFRDKLQSMPAVQFIETRQQVQQSALDHIREQLTQYEVETRGVYIQDVILPQELVQVLTQREIANQEKATYQMQQEAQHLRIDMEKAKGTADMQAQLAQAQVGVDIATQTAEARKQQADGEATYIAANGPREVGRSRGGRAGPGERFRGPGSRARSRPDGDHQRRHGVGRPQREDHARHFSRRRRRESRRRRRDADEVLGRQGWNGGNGDSGGAGGVERVGYAGSRVRTKIFQAKLTALAWAISRRPTGRT